MEMDFSESKSNLREDFDVLSDDFDEEPLANGWGSYGDFQLVGNGEVTNSFCGTFKSFKGCLRSDLHERIGKMRGEDWKGKVFVRKVHHWCNKSSCPICFKSGWAVREARKIEARLEEASKRFGLVEHIIVGIPSKFWGLSFEDLRKKCLEALAVRGVVGGVLIFHGFRYNVQKHWYWSPHFHVLGFIRGGYGKCRGCAKCRKGCGGFVDRNYRFNEKDGIYVKVKGRRKTVFGTAWYQLNHSSIKRGVKRFHVAVWWGVCSYRKLKVKVHVKKDVCPICQYELVNLRYNGVHGFELNRRSLCYVCDSVEDLEEDGLVVWSEAVKRSFYRSDNYE